MHSELFWADPVDEKAELRKDVANAMGQINTLCEHVHNGEVRENLLQSEAAAMERNIVHQLDIIDRQDVVIKAARHTAKYYTVSQSLLNALKELDNQPPAPEYVMPLTERLRKAETEIEQLQIVVDGLMNQNRQLRGAAVVAWEAADYYASDQAYRVEFLVQQQKAEAVVEAADNLNRCRADDGLSVRESLEFELDAALDAYKKGGVSDDSECMDNRDRPLVGGGCKTDQNE